MGELLEIRLYERIMTHLITVKDLKTVVMLLLSSGRLYRFLLSVLLRGDSLKFLSYHQRRLRIANKALKLGYAGVALRLIDDITSSNIGALMLFDKPRLFKLAFCKFQEARLRDDRRHPLTIARQVAMSAIHYDSPRLFEWALQASMTSGRSDKWAHFCRGFDWKRVIETATRTRSHRIVEWLGVIYRANEHQLPKYDDNLGNHEIFLRETNYTLMLHTNSDKFIAIDGLTSRADFLPPCLCFPCRVRVFLLINSILSEAFSLSATQRR